MNMVHRPDGEETVTPADYPELAALAWNRDPSRPMPSHEAFSLYERNWRHVREDLMNPNEKALLERLTARFGKGLFLA